MVRTGNIEMLPLSAGEIRDATESFVERLFDHPTGIVASRCDALSRGEYAEAITVGGFPELVLGVNTRRFRGAWCRSYLETVTALANVEQVAEVRRPDLVSTWPSSATGSVIAFVAGSCSTPASSNSASGIGCTHCP